MSFKDEKLCKLLNIDPSHTRQSSASASMYVHASSQGSQISFDPTHFRILRLGVPHHFYNYPGPALPH
jgi:hypothetical protein